jgi:hypothetical protein
MIIGGVPDREHKPDAQITHMALTGTERNEAGVPLDRIARVCFWPLAVHQLREFMNMRGQWFVVRNKM